MITYEYTKIEPTVLSYRGYDNFIIRMTVGMTATDENGNTAYHEETHALQTDIEFNDSAPFIPFDEMTKDDVIKICENIAQIGHFKTRLNEKLYSTTIPRVVKFNWQE